MASLSINPLVVFIPVISCFVVIAVTTYRMRKIYEVRYSDFFVTLNVSSSHFVGSSRQVGQILFGGGPYLSIIHPIKGQRASFSSLFVDKEIILQMGDKELFKLYKIRKWAGYINLVYGPLSPIILVFVWASLYQA